MKQLPLLLLFTIGACAQAAAQTILIDNFDEYNSGSYIQDQNPDYARFGAATTDGIYSISAGYTGEGANYDVDFTPGAANGYVSYSPTTPLNLTSTPEVQLELEVSNDVVGTTVDAIIGDASTSFEITLPQALENTTYQQFSFDFEPTDTTVVSGTDSLSTVLADTTSILFHYQNTTTANGSEQINFDNLQVSSVPEPSANLLFLGAAGFGMLVWRRRLARQA